MRDPDFGLAFRRAEKPGVYFRVLNEGEICPGDRVTLVENTDPTVSMLTLFRLCYDTSPGRDALESALGAPIAERLRKRFEAKLAALPAA
jgi:MOSC domain-containing protein YiiM